MTKAYIRFALWSIVLIFLQIIVMNNIRIFGYLLPVLYLYPLFVLPYQTPRWLTTLLASLIGLCMDMAMNTPGLNMSACTLVGFVRQPILFQLTEEEILEGLSVPLSPSVYVVKVGRYILYFVLMVTTHVSALFLLEAFSVQLFRMTLPYILGSSIITLLLIFIIEALSKRNHSV